MKKISLILFDIGNVLVKLTGASIIQNNSKKLFSKDYVWETWVSLKDVRDFETGKSDQKTFANKVIEFYDLNLDSTQFIGLFRSAAERKFDGVDIFLEHLSEEYELACLTNTNSIQWPKIKNEFGLGTFFQKQYVSYELGYMKPDTEVFEYVLTDTGLIPEEILFIDDSLLNIEVAKDLKFQFCHVKDFEDTKNKISELIRKPNKRMQQTSLHDVADA